MITVVIPAYKKTKMLVENLRHNLSYLTLKKCEVIVVNDDPSESIRKDLQPFNLTLLENKKNLGFGGAVTVGVKKAKGQYIMLLNSDVILHNDSYKNALVHFKKNKKLFAVSFLQKEKNNEKIGKNRLYWKMGFIQHGKALDLSFGLTGWAEGGACMIRKGLYQKLGGFDEIYSPFYWEDIDLSYRAWKSGYTILFDPTVEVTHHHESTIGTYFTPLHVRKIAYRNQFFFVWKNITSSLLLISHVLLVLPNIVLHFFQGDFLFLKSFFLALKKLPTVIQARKSAGPDFVRSDREVLSTFHE